MQSMRLRVSFLALAAAGTVLVPASSNAAGAANEVFPSRFPSADGIPLVEELGARLRGQAAAGDIAGLIREGDKPATTLEGEETFDWSTPAGDLDGDGVEDLYLLVDRGESREFEGISGATGRVLSRAVWSGPTVRGANLTPRLGSCFLVRYRWAIVWEVTGDAADDLVFISWAGDEDYCARAAHDRVAISVQVIPGGGEPVGGWAAPVWESTEQGSETRVRDAGISIYRGLPWDIDIRGFGRDAEILMTVLDTRLAGLVTSTRILRAADGLAKERGTITSEMPVQVGLGGDLDGDARSDLLVWSSSTERLAAHDGDGSVQWSHALPGARYAWPSAVSLDGDGTDVAVWAVGGARAFSAVDGATGSLLWSEEPDGSDVSLVDDLDGDGGRDVVVTQDESFAVVYRSGADGEALASRTMLNPDGDRFLWTWGVVGDLDGDSVGDLLFVTSPDEIVFCAWPPTQPSGVEVGHVAVSGRTLEPLWTLRSDACSDDLWFTYGDVDGDGGMDVWFHDSLEGTITFLAGATARPFLVLPGEGVRPDVFALEVDGRSSRIIIRDEAEHSRLTAYALSGRKVWQKTQA